MEAEAMEATCQYVTFMLGDETYAFDVNNTREIADYTAITPIPNTPDWVRGVINLRGTVIPVLDIKRKFGLEGRPLTSETRIIIVELNIGSEHFVLGILADAVKDVFELARAKIEPPPRFGGSISVKYIVGIGRIADCFFVILDVEKIFTEDELVTASEVSAG